MKLFKKLLTPNNGMCKFGIKSIKTFFVENLHTSKMTEAQKKALKPRLCYSLSILLHIGCMVICGYKFGGGNDDELAHGPELVRQFIKAVGKEVMKKLIMDRGYISAEFINELKSKYDVDVVIPLRSNMNAFTDSIRIAEKFKKM